MAKECYDYMTESTTKGPIKMTLKRAKEYSKKLTGISMKGHLNNDRMHGRGKYTWSDGRSYDGEYKNGMKHGYGKLVWPGGETYEGYWQADLQHGEGLFIGLDKIPRNGKWDNGERVD